MHQKSALKNIRMSSFHIHIDPVGGIAGDMFVAAMLDLFPELQEGMLKMLHCISILKDVEVQITEHRDQVLVGKRCIVSGPEFEHHHNQYTNLVTSVVDSSLAPEIKERACEILHNLAHAEAAVHGVGMDSVTLHEVGSLDSLTDIVCAAYLLSVANIASWSCTPLPSGNGKISTAHGELPLPAPAVVRLLEGYPVHNDGRIGERVTPTGAAILRSINPQFDVRWEAMTLGGMGNGFGSTTFDNISNIVRLTAYEVGAIGILPEKIAVVEFEIDDQTPEDLSIGLERLRHTEGVLDIIQMPAFGKKNRMVIHVQILAEYDCIRKIIAQCALETSTLGVRVQMTERLALPRKTQMEEFQKGTVPIKVVQRPDGQITAKVEADHLAQSGNYGERKSAKQECEREIESKSHEV